MHKTRRWEPVAGLIFCYGNEENGHCACTSRHLTTANQRRDSQSVSRLCGIYTSLGAGSQLWDIHKPERWLSAVGYTQALALALSCGIYTSLGAGFRLWHLPTNKKIKR